MRSQNFPRKISWKIFSEKIFVEFFFSHSKNRAGGFLGRKNTPKNSYFWWEDFWEGRVCESDSPHLPKFPLLFHLSETFCPKNWNSGIELKFLLIWWKTAIWWGGGGSNRPPRVSPAQHPLVPDRDKGAPWRSLTATLSNLAHACPIGQSLFPKIIPIQMKFN